MTRNVSVLQPVSPQAALTDRVRSAILDAIVAGALRPGERLAQAQIAERLGVSRQPVSHALRVLKEQGIVVALGRKGLTVAAVEPERLRHLYQVRGALDALAARLAADRVADGVGDDGALATLCALVARHDPPSRHRVSVDELVQADVAFHVALYRASGNSVLEDLAEPHWVHFRRSMHAVLEDQALRAGVWPEHRAILEAVRCGDGARAALRAQQHTHRAGETTAVRLVSIRQREESAT